MLTMIVMYAAELGRPQCERLQKSPYKRHAWILENDPCSKENEEND
jgi:hypothetical protein